MTTAARLQQRSLLGVKDLSREEIESILDRAQYWEASGKKIHNAAPDAVVANLFFENSTRTRFSFEMAAKRLGAQVLNFSAAVSSVNKGESIYDTVRTLESIGIDAGIIRLKPIGVLPEIASRVSVPLINAGDGNNEHPTQALLDLYTMRKHFGEIQGSARRDHRRHPAQPGRALQSVGAPQVRRGRLLLRAAEPRGAGA